MKSVIIAFAVLVCAAVASANVLQNAVAGPAPRMCMIYCQYGFELDTETGHQMCKCRANPVCEPVMCMIHCESGFDTAENGCEVCRCKPTCPVAMCHFMCPNGFVYDVNGCKTCHCHSTPAIRPTLIPSFVLENAI